MMMLRKRVTTTACLKIHLYCHRATLIERKTQLLHPQRKNHLPKLHCQSMELHQGHSPLQYQRLPILPLPLFLFKNRKKNCLWLNTVFVRAAGWVARVTDWVEAGSTGDEARVRTKRFLLKFDTKGHPILPNLHFCPTPTAQHLTSTFYCDLASLNERWSNVILIYYFCSVKHNSLHTIKTILLSILLILVKNTKKETLPQCYKDQ